MRVKRSRQVVFWSFAALGNLPVDVLLWRFDIAGLAVDAAVRESSVSTLDDTGEVG